MPATASTGPTAPNAAPAVADPNARARSHPGAPPAHGPAIAAVAIALALLTLAGAAPSEHLFTDRDPSVYINTGRSIAGTHRAHPQLVSGPFDDSRAFTSKSVGFTIRSHRI